MAPASAVLESVVQALVSCCLAESTAACREARSSVLTPVMAPSRYTSESSGSVPSAHSNTMSFTAVYSASERSAALGRPKLNSLRTSSSTPSSTVAVLV